MAASILGCGVNVVYSAQPTLDESTSQKPGQDLEQSNPEVQPETGGSFLTRDPDFMSDSDFAGGTSELFFRAMLAVLFVIILGVSAIYVSKRLLPRIINSPGRSIRIVETIHIGSKKAIHVIEVGNRRLLLGSTAEKITKLADITNDLTDLSAKQEGGS